MSISEILYYGGLLTAGIAVLGMGVAMIYFHSAKKKLQAQLTLEYGKRRT